MNIFVGNLSFDATEGDVKKLFEGFGNVASVVIVMGRRKRRLSQEGLVLSRCLMSSRRSLR